VTLHFACHRDDMEVGTVRRVDLDGHRIALVRLSDGFRAVGDRCSHADYSLSEGDVWEEDCMLECPKHGSRFSLADGEPETLPATRPVPVYAVTVEGDDVLVDVPAGGDGQADE
jgi:3-phenylpropionate/trans-cinnamate dioxygenase ferredoxin subunit